MRVPRVRLTVRRLMAAVAVTGALMGWASDRARRGYPLVLFEYPCVIENEPLVRPTKILAIGEREIALEDGRLIRIEDGPLLVGKIGWEEPGRVASFVDVETGPSGSITVYTLQGRFACGTCERNRYRPPICIPLVARTVYRNYRALVGTGKVVGVIATPGR